MIKACEHNGGRQWCVAIADVRDQGSIQTGAVDQSLFATMLQKALAPGAELHLFLGAECRAERAFGVDMPVDDERVRFGGSCREGTHIEQHGSVAIQMLMDDLFPDETLLEGIENTHALERGRRLVAQSHSFVEIEQPLLQSRALQRLPTRSVAGRKVVRLCQRLCEP